MSTLFPAQSVQLPAALARLSDLAYNLWFSWNDGAKALFADIDPELWHRSHHNPVRLLSEVSADTLERLSSDEPFLRQYEYVVRQFDDYMQAPTWFRQQYPQHAGQAIAYFSAEFGFHESLPIYSGGLGVLAGDHCKSASDLGLPLIGVGLLYKKGYFNQRLDLRGSQFAENMPYEFTELPIRPVELPASERDDAGDGAPAAAGEMGSPSGGELYVSVPVADRIVRLKVWQAQVGRIRVLLLDADLEENSPWDRELTAQLYGGSQDVRIAQEILLGMGGVRALRALRIPTGVYHINEGHAAFLTFERLREQLEQGLPFHVALEVVRASTIFTTHTPVAAGHDAFPLTMFDYYFTKLFNDYPSLRHELTSLGFDEPSRLFNMTHLALSTSALRNGVSKLHGHVSREMFRAFHGQIDTREVPIGHITNGVHLETWLAPQLKQLLDRFLPGSWIRHQANRDVWQAIELVPNESLWKVHEELKETMIRLTRANLAEQRRRNGLPEKEIDETRGYLSKHALTIGFARRFATYKRSNLIFSDLKRLAKLVNDPERPVQFVFAGKAHPADGPGQELIREIYKVSQLEPFKGKVILLENYDIDLARALVQGVDIWLNNPRRPYEASGTSGQKAAMNGVINFSVLDGWWEEGYDGSNGWSIDSDIQADMATQERQNTESLYRVLEQEIIPLYYNQNPLPAQWIERMKRSIRTLAPVYNTDRMVADYTSGAYVPALVRTRQFVSNGYEEARKVADYKRFMRDNWHHVRVIEVSDSPAGGMAAPGAASALKDVSATVHFGPIWYRDTAVELIYYEDTGSGWEQVVVEMEPARQLGEGIYMYRAAIPAHLRHGAHFSLRVHPVSASFATRFELPLVKTY
ncbi:starch phosphorylase [Paenibacillus sp. UNCCL117]|uniref:alpha-glucan family phosphorylase n=1 Tax=unclassified Paenibacillus TaxID=185978 RepID=UPI00088BD489|nr:MULTISPECIES: alpha-glucan family phosphorylase [unclassified Paenibacillus]SDE01609.1 maltodextrin phosphorylase [Paenibacillus sp. cl123]SFW57032.1 starch phosphorylase [Paenibacillus sp. UNCCL117]